MVPPQLRNRDPLKPEDSYIPVTVKGYRYNVRFDILPHIQMRKLMNHYSRVAKTPRSLLTFYYNGKEITDTDTICSINFIPGGTITTVTLWLPPPT